MQTLFTSSVPASMTGRNVRQLLQHWLISKKWQHFLRINRQVTINGQYRSFNRPVTTGEEVQLDFSFVPSVSQYYSPAPGQLPICYEDEQLLVVNKPAGLKTHPNQPSDTNTVFNILSGQLATPPLMVHRLDQSTSGALLVAKTPVVVPLLDRQLSQKIMGRDYLAWVANPPQGNIPAAGQIELPLGPDPTDKRKRRVDRQHGQTALTRFKVQRRLESRTLLRLTLSTGRTHQLRVHLAASGWPIIGDPLYQPQPAGHQPMLLHATELHYNLPFSEERRTVFVPQPDYFPLT